MSIKFYIPFYLQYGETSMKKMKRVKIYAMGKAILIIAEFSRNCARVSNRLL